MDAWYSQYHLSPSKLPNMLILLGNPTEWHQLMYFDISRLAKTTSWTIFIGSFQVQVSLEVLENYVPAYFRGARKVYTEMMREQHVNKNKAPFKQYTRAESRCTYAFN